MKIHRPGPEERAAQQAADGADRCLSVAHRRVPVRRRCAPCSTASTPAPQASSSTRIVTIRSTSLIFSMPTSHAETIRARRACRTSTWANWFGGIYKDPQNFFAQFAIEPESYLRMYPEIILTPEERKAFLEDRTGCIVGDGLAKRYGFKVGDRIVLQVGHSDLRHRRTSRSPSAASTGPAAAAVDNQSMMFHWKYADERSIEKGQVGLVSSRRSTTPISAAQVAGAIDQQFANSPYETKTDTEQQFHELVRLDVRQPEPAARQHRARRRHHDAVCRRQHDGDVGPRADDRNRGHADARVSRGVDLPVHRGRRAADVASSAGFSAPALARLIVNAETLGMAGGFIPGVRRQHRERRRSASGSARSSASLAGDHPGDRWRRG